MLVCRNLPPRHPLRQAAAMGELNLKPGSGPLPEDCPPARMRTVRERHEGLRVPESDPVPSPGMPPLGIPMDIWDIAWGKS